MVSTALTTLFGDGLTLLFTALRVVVVYLVLLGLLRLVSRRTLGQMTPFDLVTLLLISNVVQNAMIGPDLSLTGGLLGAGVLLGLNYLVASSPRLRRGLERDPVMLVYQGRVMAEHLQHEGVSVADLEAAVREHGVADLRGVETAVLEMDGTISVIPKGEAQARRLRRVRSSRNR
jgi:uncharacterized membrane protein YcaP (DUF421 family)